MKAAIEAIRNKEKGSYKASRVFSLPQTTPRRYVKYRQKSSSETIKTEMGRKQILPCEVANDLAEHCRFMERKTFGLTMAGAKPKVFLTNTCLQTRHLWNVILSLLLQTNDAKRRVDVRQLNRKVTAKGKMTVSTNRAAEVQAWLCVLRKQAVRVLLGTLCFMYRVHLCSTIFIYCSN